MLCKLTPAHAHDSRARVLAHCKLFITCSPPFAVPHNDYKLMSSLAAHTHVSICMCCSLIHPLPSNNPLRPMLKRDLSNTSHSTPHPPSASARLRTTTYSSNFTNSTYHLPEMASHQPGQQQQRRRCERHADTRPPSPWSDGAGHQHGLLMVEGSALIQHHDP